MNTNIPKLIKAELKQAKVTEAELAEFIDCTPEEFEEIMQGRRKPTVAEAIAIAQFFDLEPMLFLGGK